MDEIHLEFLKVLDVVGLSWLTRLCNIAWTSGTVPLEWQTGVVVPLFKKGDQRLCSNYRGITLLSLPGKVYSRVMERRVPRLVEEPDSGGTAWFSSWSWNTGPTLNPRKGAGGGVGVCPASPHVFCGSGEGLRPCPPRYLVGGAPGVWDQWLTATGFSFSLFPEREFGSHF